MIITVNDIRAAGFCVDGLKLFCKQNGIDFRRLINEGLPYEELAIIDDVMVKKLLEVARGRS